MNKKRTKQLRKELLEVLSKHKDKMKHFKYYFHKAKKAYKTGLLTFLLTMCLLVNMAFADKLQVPFPCYPKKMQTVYAKHGIKLDLNAEDRTSPAWFIRKLYQYKNAKWFDKVYNSRVIVPYKGSWGFIKSEGNCFWIYTYYSLKTEDFEFIRDIMWECLGE